MMADTLLSFCESVYEEALKAGEERPMANVLGELAHRLVPQQKIPNQEFPGLYYMWCAKHDIKARLLNAAGRPT